MCSYLKTLFTRVQSSFVHMDKEASFFTQLGSCFAQNSFRSFILLHIFISKNVELLRDTRKFSLLILRPRESEIREFFHLSLWTYFFLGVKRSQFAGEWNAVAGKNIQENKKPSASHIAAFYRMVLVGYPALGGLPNCSNP